jgi:hypothetical protein
MKFRILFLLMLFGLTEHSNSFAQCSVSTTPTNYCGSGDAIDAFTLNSIASTGNSGCASSGYAFYSTPVRSLTIGQTYSFSASMASFWNNGFAIWIDLNGNGFYESSEQLYQSSSPSTSHSGNITIPSTATAGTNVRMRTMCAYNTTILASEACSSNLGSGYGETEDYYVNLVSSCPVTITTQPVDSTICSGNNATFNIVATNTNTYQWQVSTNGGSSWSNVSNGGVYGGATTNTLSITAAPFSMNNYQYRCVCTNTSSSCSVNSNAGKLIMNETPAILSTTPGFACAGGAGSVSATGPVGATIQWYNQSSGGSLLGTGNTLNIPVAPVSTTNYYAFPHVTSTIVNDSLSAILSATNSQRGCYMDIKPLTNITMTDVSWVPASSLTYDVSVYFKTGTSVGFETNSAAWTLIGSATGVSVTAGVPHKITLSSSQALTANTTYSILVIRTGSSGSIRYHTATSPGLGNVWSQNSDLQLIVAKGISGLFTGTLFSPRQLACIIWYSKGGAAPCTATTRTAVPLNINTAPVISVHPTNKTICNLTNTSFSVTATNVASYQWQVSTNGGSTWSNVTNGGVYSNATTATLNITGATTAMAGYVYRCQLTTSCSVVANTNNATLSVNPSPGVTAQPTNKIICNNGGTTFSTNGSGFGTITYQWQVSTNSGSTWSNITNGGVYSGATSATLTLTGATVSMNGYMYRSVISGGCSPAATTNAATLTVNSAPAVTSNPTNSTICPNGNTSFTCSGTGSGITYQWQVSTNGGVSYSNITNGGVYSNATTATLNITNAPGTMNGYRYRCIISGSCSPFATTTEARLIMGAAPVVTVQPPSKVVCTGTTGSTSLTATGYINTYQWEVSTNSGGSWAPIANGGFYAGVTTNTLQFNSPILSMSGYMYRCVVTNACAVATTSNAMTLTVANSPVTTLQPTNKIVCSGDNTTYTVAATSSAPISYQWQGSVDGITWTNIANGGIFSGATTTTLTLTGVYQGTFNRYRCELNTGCIPAATSNVATLTVETAPLISINPSNQVKCVGQNASFAISATGSNLTYQWQLSTNGGASWANVANGGVYAGATTNNLLLTAVPASMNAYRYRCVVTGSCPTVKTSTSATLTVNTPVAINTNTPTALTFCSGSNTSLSVGATGTGISYRWYLNVNGVWTALNNSSTYSGVTTATLNISNMAAPVNTIVYQYRCVVTGICNTMSSNTTTITVHARPNITSNPSSVTRCDSTGPLSFKITATGSQLVYQWQLNTGSGWNNLVNNSTYSGVTTPNLGLSNVFYSMNGYQYRCVVTGVCTPTVTSSVATLTVNPLLLPSVVVNVTNDDICTGTSVTFTPSPTNGGTSPGYVWKRNGATVGTGSSYTTTTLANGDEVWCDMTSNAVCPLPKTVRSDNTITMKVTPYSTPTIVVTSDVGTTWCSGKPAVFRANITNGGMTPMYEWQVNGQIVGSSVDTYLTAQLLNGDQVRCRLTSSLKCPSPTVVTSNTLTMTINPTTRSSIVIAPNPDSVVCAKAEVTMYSFFTNGGATPSFQWMLNGQDIPGETGGTLKTTSLNNGDMIQCRFISSATCVFPEVSLPVTFGVNPLLDPSVSVIVYYIGNETFRFTAIPVNGGPNPSYQWYKNTVPISGATSETYDAVGISKTDKIHVLMASSEDCVNPELLQVSSRSLTTGVGELSNSFADLGLYPNPNKGQFNIKGTLSKPVADKEVMVKITNSVGQAVYTQVYNAGGVNIDLPVQLQHDLPNGMYQVNVAIDGNVTNLRFVLNR